MSNTELLETLKEREGMHFKIEKFTVSEEDVKRCQLRDMINGRSEYDDFHAGTYIRLVDKERSSFNRGVIMSNTPMELKTNQEFIERANGDVLIVGLGLGLVVLAIQEKENVKSITVVEKFKEIIDIVGSSQFNDKVKIIDCDIFGFRSDLKFDTIYFDVWNDVCGDNWEEMKVLKKSFRKNLNRENPNRWIGCWREGDTYHLYKD